MDGPGEKVSQSLNVPRAGTKSGTIERPLPHHNGYVVSVHADTRANAVEAGTNKVVDQTSLGELVQMTPN